jgi:pimeloyl-ACP methyl ester carboxylesterase
MTDAERESGELRAYRDGYLVVEDGLRLHYRDYPGDRSKPPLICLHGLTRNARDFAEFANRYAPGHRVLVPEFRGRGESDYDPQPGRYNPLIYAGDVLELLDDLHLDRAIFVGTSLGGLVTMTLARMAPNRIAATVLNDVGPDLSPEGLERIRTYLGRDLRFSTWDEAARAIAESNRHVPERYGDQDWLRMARRVCRGRNGEIVFDYDMAITQPFETRGATPNVDLWPLFEALATKPLLVLRGEHSDLLSVQTAEKMQQAAPGARFVTVPGVGHAPMLNEPEAVAAIDDLLETVAP